MKDKIIKGNFTDKDWNSYLLEEQSKKPGLTHTYLENALNVNGLNSYQSMLDKSPISNSDTILDIACGDGCFASYLIATGLKPSYTGVDISTDEINLGSEKYKRHKNIDFTKTEASNLPFENDYFSKVFCHMALHMMNSPQNVLSEINRVLAPNGRAIFVIRDATVSNTLMNNARKATQMTMVKYDKKFKFGNIASNFKTEESIFEKFENYFNRENILVTREAFSTKMSLNSLTRMFFDMYPLSLIPKEHMNEFSDYFKAEFSELIEINDNLVFEHNLMSIIVNKD